MIRMRFSPSFKASETDLAASVVSACRDVGTAGAGVGGAASQTGSLATLSLRGLPDHPGEVKGGGQRMEIQLANANMMKPQLGRCWRQQGR